MIFTLRCQACPGNKGDIAGTQRGMPVDPDSALKALARDQANPEFRLSACVRTIPAARPEQNAVIESRADVVHLGALPGGVSSSDRPAEASTAHAPSLPYLDDSQEPPLALLITTISSRTIKTVCVVMVEVVVRARRCERSRTEGHGRSARGRPDRHTDGSGAVKHGPVLGRLSRSRGRGVTSGESGVHDFPPGCWFRGSTWIFGPGPAPSGR
jgi:hypothetical protein